MFCRTFMQFATGFVFSYKTFSYKLEFDISPTKWPNWMHYAVFGAEEKFLDRWYIKKQFLSILKEFYCLQSVLKYIITFGNTHEMH